MLNTKQEGGKPSPKLDNLMQLKKKELSAETQISEMGSNFKILSIPPPRISEHSLVLDESSLMAAPFGEENLVDTSTLEGNVESAHQLFANV